MDKHHGNDKKIDRHADKRTRDSENDSNYQTETLIEDKP